MVIHFRHGLWEGSDADAEIDLLISPSLEKIDTADGGRFESRLVLRKALAVTHQRIEGVGQAVKRTRRRMTLQALRSLGKRLIPDVDSLSRSWKKTCRWVQDDCETDKILAHIS